VKQWYRYLGVLEVPCHYLIFIAFCDSALVAGRVTNFMFFTAAHFWSVVLLQMLGFGWILGLFIIGGVAYNRLTSTSTNLKWFEVGCCCCTCLDLPVHLGRGMLCECFLHCVSDFSL